MKNWFSRNSGELPPFVHNRRLRRIMLFIALIVIYGVVISFLYNIAASIILIVISVMGLIYTIVMMNEMSTDTNRYISDLSYRIHRGEQESLLEMPIGVMILNDAGSIEWVNPYLMRYFNNENVLGKRIEDIDHDLQQLIMKYEESDEFHTVTWRDHKFTMLIQNEYHSVYMFDITRYATWKNVTKKNRFQLVRFFWIITMKLLSQ